MHWDLIAHSAAAYAYLIVFVGVSKKVFEEVQAGAVPHQDQVCIAVSEVGEG